MWDTHASTHARTHTHIHLPEVYEPKTATRHEHTHTLSHSLSLSLSNTHTHTHTCPKSMSPRPPACHTRTHTLSHTHTHLVVAALEHSRIIPIVENSGPRLQRSFVKFISHCLVCNFDSTSCMQRYRGVSPCAHPHGCTITLAFTRFQ